MRRTTRRSARAAWWHYYSLVFSHSRVVKIIMFLGVKVRKRAKNGKRRAACFLFSKNRRRETKHWSNSQQPSFRLSSFHKKKKEKNSSNHFSSWRRVLPPRTTPRSRRYSSRYITKIEVCALHSARAFAFFLFFSLSTEEDRRNHHRRRISWTRLHLWLTHSSFLSLCVLI